MSPVGDEHGVAVAAEEWSSPSVRCDGGVVAETAVGDQAVAGCGLDTLTTCWEAIVLRRARTDRRRRCRRRSRRRPRVVGPVD
jgi:hypothetical protein